ncbi:MAG: hypothetical protein JW953_13375 [Anaerolineae bacterium]|nr:hypothetical protein [Anaerolineae bacterium]
MLAGLYSVGWGGWFGGQANAVQVRAAIAWASVPKIWGLLLWLPQLIIFRQELFVSFTPRIDTNPMLLLLLLGFGALELVIDGWAFIVLLKCLGEVHQFSAWKALGTVVTTTLIIGVPMLILVLVVVWAGGL